MTLLLPREAWLRRTVALPAPLEPLADGLARDLDPALARPLYIPDEKALLSREGGRCPTDGTLLEFDPFDDRRHRCAGCGSEFDSEYHRGFWRYWYHLWLAERAVHAAVLYAARRDERHAAFAASVVEGYADRYLRYPNRDNVLGPSRPFFSTYLESIWLLQLCIATDALEAAGAERSRAVGAAVRDRLVAPSAELIASYDEAMSNRQVWNVAARFAAARLLDRPDEAERILHEPHGLTFLLRSGLLEDGTWYEGENYHLFAHRGLWYTVSMAEAAGLAIPADLLARFQAGFIAPFRTAMPDMTLPSRRDSQYAISLRQPRFAESCELGLARRDDHELAGVLACLYEAPDDVQVRNNGRTRTSADVERNLPPMRLSRADLGWRALLFARETLPAAPPRLPGSTLLEGQGIAVVRRNDARIYVALDYGHSGGGHGHPDRLHLLLADGRTRWLDDMGTGSYVDRSLHWYRSTLAHNAPLVDGHSQQRVDGRLDAFEDRGGAGWVRATAPIAAGVLATRTVIVMPDYLVDEVRWESDREITLDLPVHAPLELEGEGWQSMPLSGGGDLEDGFDFVTDAACRTLPPGRVAVLGPPPRGQALLRPPVMRVHAASDGEMQWWRLTGPAAPGAGRHTFHLVRRTGRSGWIRSVWAWARDAARTVVFSDDTTRVEHDRALADVHMPVPGGWHIDLEAEGARSSIDLGGLRAPAALEGDTTVAARKHGRPEPRELSAGGALEFSLGELEYRRSEESWREAGEPRAHGKLRWDACRLTVELQVVKRDALVIAPPGAENPLDNEVPEINADGVQLYLRAGSLSGAWVVVPVADSTGARAVPIRGWAGLELSVAEWAPTSGGYRLHIGVELPPGAGGGEIVHVGVIVNETAPGRARRRGQLVLGGANGEWTYLRGDRHDPERLLPVRLGR